MSPGRSLLSVARISRPSEIKDTGARDKHTGAREERRAPGKNVGRSTPASARPRLFPPSEKKCGDVDRGFKRPTFFPLRRARHRRR
jgi:hypothetical protein